MTDELEQPEEKPYLEMAWYSRCQHGNIVLDYQGGGAGPPEAIDMMFDGLMKAMEGAFKRELKDAGLVYDEDNVRHEDRAPWFTNVDKPDPSGAGDEP